jgi:hypothetical protein
LSPAQVARFTELEKGVTSNVLKKSLRKTGWCPDSNEKTWVQVLTLKVVIFFFFFLLDYCAKLNASTNMVK